MVTFSHNVAHSHYVTQSVMAICQDYFNMYTGKKVGGSESHPLFVCIFIYFLANGDEKDYIVNIGDDKDYIVNNSDDKDYIVNNGDDKDIVNNSVDISVLFFAIQQGIIATS